MSKGKKRSSGNVNGGSSAEGSSGLGPSGRRPMVRKTLIERLLFKVDAMRSYGVELAKMLLVRGAPDEITQIAHDFVPVLEKYREKFLGLSGSGWVPAEKSPKKDFAVGDRVTVIKAQLPRYDYIPGLSSGNTQLVAEKFVNRGESAKFIDVLVKDASTGVPYGLIPRHHLVGA